MFDTPEFLPTRGRVAGLYAGIALLLTAGALPAPAQAAGVRNVVYVQSNDPGGNAILAYKRDASGALTPLRGSPFAMGGLGITPSFDLGPFDSDQEIIANPAKTLLFATNGGSDTIAVFAIAPDGSLSHVAGSPFFSGGSNPVSLGLSGDVLCVVNKDNDPGHKGMYLPSITTFRVTPAGRLTPIPKSTLYGPLGSDPTQALIAPGGGLVFNADFLGGLLQSFRIAPSGKISALAAVPPPPSEFAGSGKPALPLGLAAHPTRSLIYVGFVTINRIGIYKYDASGALKFVRSVPESGQGVCWLLVNPGATRLYASNTVDPSVSVFDISRDPTNPVEIQKINLRVVPGSNPGGYQFGLDPTGKFLYVVGQQFSDTSTSRANALHVFSVGADGRLVEVASSPMVLPVPNLTRPQGLLAL